MKTSSASPIYVSFLVAEDADVRGRIGLTIAPGKRDGLSNRDLDADLQRLRDEFGCRLLVSLLEAHEYAWLGIENLFESAADLAIDTLHFAIEDASVPPPGAMPQFIQLVERIVAAARDGSTVVIHCRGGLGRTGTVAASCLVALGHDPTHAIERVRAVRPGAVETPAQERWVGTFADAWQDHLRPPTEKGAQA